MLGMVVNERSALRLEPSHKLHDLSHEADELKHHEDASVRIAAQVVGSAAALVLEEREGK